MSNTTIDAKTAQQYRVTKQPEISYVEQTPTEAYSTSESSRRHRHSPQAGNVTNFCDDLGQCCCCICILCSCDSDSNGCDSGGCDCGGCDCGGCDCVC
jgi:hypothetical protein